MMLGRAVASGDIVGTLAGFLLKREMYTECYYVVMFSGRTGTPTAHRAIRTAALSP